METRELANSPRLKEKMNNVKELLFVQNQDWKQEAITCKSDQKNSPLLSISFFKKTRSYPILSLIFPKNRKIPLFFFKNR